MDLGIDIHKRYAQVAVMDSSGEIVEEVRVDANLDELAQRYAGADAAIEGERYGFHIVVESPASVPAYTEDIASIVTAGIPVYRTEEFEQFRSLIEGMVDER